METDESDRIIATPLLLEIIADLLGIESDTLFSRIGLSRDEVDDGAVFT